MLLLHSSLLGYGAPRRWYWCLQRDLADSLTRSGVSAAQIGLVASQFSLPMLAPLLFGTGILLRSIRTNASLIFPRIGVVVVLLWMLWFFNSVVQNTVVYLRRQASPAPILRLQGVCRCFWILGMTVASGYRG